MASASDNADCETICDCIIEDLIDQNFESRSPSEKKRIVKLGRPIPRLTIVKQTKAFVRHFQKDWYETSTWLCGCLKLQKNFCWPCLLYSNETNIWSKYGFDDLNNLSKARKRHEVSRSHIISFVKLRQFERQCNSENVLGQSEIDSEKLNRTIIANRYIITKMINVICFMSGQYLTLQSQLGAESNTRGRFVELIYLLSSLDSELKFHLDESTVFKEASKKIQNDVIHSIGLVLIEEIIKEIRSASHASIMLNVADSVAHGSQLTTVLRYIMKGTGDVKERFVGLDPIVRSEDCAIVHHIDNCYEKFGWLNLNFVAHSYDAVTVNGHQGIQATMKEVYKYSLFTHCYDLPFDIVFSQCVRSLKDCQLFFQTLSGFSSFFYKSPERMSALKESVTGSIEWNNHSSVIKYIMNHQEEIKPLLLKMCEAPDQWDVDTAVSARGLHHFLTDFRFRFWLLTFHKIFSLTNELFDNLFKGTVQFSYCNIKTGEFINSLKDIRNDFESIWNAVEDEEDEEEPILSAPANKRIRLDKESLPDKESSRETFHTVIDIISKICSERYTDLKPLQFMSLLNGTEFKAYSRKFPDAAFTTLNDVYGRLFDIPKLKAELLYLYSRPDFVGSSLESIRNTLLQDNLYDDVLNETYSLIMLIYAMPCIKPPLEAGQLSTMERIQTFLKNTQPEEELSSLALICVEKEFLINIQESTTAEFYDRVIRHFAKKNPSIMLLRSKEKPK